MMAKWVAKQRCRSGEIHSQVYGCRASDGNSRKLTISTRVLEEPLMDYPGLR
ncbi:MAG TPA: hypothetical protein VF243_06610 [Nitrosospira sp.]